MWLKMLECYRPFSEVGVVIGVSFERFGSRYLVAKSTFVDQI
jgi:hypothetical protein